MILIRLFLFLAVLGLGASTVLSAAEQQDHSGDFFPLRQPLGTGQTGNPLCEIPRETQFPVPYEDWKMVTELFAYYALCEKQSGGEITVELTDENRKIPLLFNCDFFNHEAFPPKVKAEFDRLVKNQCTETKSAQCTVAERQKQDSENCNQAIACEFARSSVGAMAASILPLVGRFVPDAPIPGCGNAPEGLNCYDKVINGIVKNLWETIYSAYEITLAGLKKLGGLYEEIKKYGIVPTYAKYRDKFENLSDNVTGFLLYLVQKDLERQGGAIVADAAREARDWARDNIPLFGRAEGAAGWAATWIGSGYGLVRDGDPTGTLQEAEDRIRNIHAVVSKLQQSPLNEFIDNPVQFLMTNGHMIGNAIWQIAVSEFGCADGNFQVRGITECKHPTPAFECATCTERTRVFCEVGGFVGTELVSGIALAVVTAGTATAAKAAVQSGGWLARLGKYADNVFDLKKLLAKLSKAGKSSTLLKEMGAAARTGGKVLGHFGRGVLQGGQGALRGFSYVAGKFDEFARSIPGIGRFLRFKDKVEESVLRSLFPNIGRGHRDIPDWARHAREEVSPSRPLADLSTTERMALAAEDLGVESLTSFQQELLEKAHVIGRGEPGRLPNTRAGVLPGKHTNYTFTHLKEKLRTLQTVDPATGKPAFTREQAKLLIRNGRAGDSVIIDDPLRGAGIVSRDGEWEDLLTGDHADSLVPLLDAALLGRVHPRFYEELSRLLAAEKPGLPRYTKGLVQQALDNAGVKIFPDEVLNVYVQAIESQIPKRHPWTQTPEDLRDEVNLWIATEKERIVHLSPARKPAASTSTPPQPRIDAQVTMPPTGDGNYTTYTTPRVQQQIGVGMRNKNPDIRHAATKAQEFLDAVRTGPFPPPRKWTFEGSPSGSPVRLLINNEPLTIHKGQEIMINIGVKDFRLKKLERNPILRGKQSAFDWENDAFEVKLPAGPDFRGNASNYRLVLFFEEHSPGIRIERFTDKQGMR